MTRLCALIEAIGNETPCASGECAYWDGGCVVEQLGLDLSNPDLAHYLADLRRAAYDEHSAATVRRELVGLAG